MVADDSRMLEHYLAQRRLMGPEVGLAPGFDFPLKVENTLPKRVF